MTTNEQRYQRQQLVSKLGSESQSQLNAAHVLIVGVGGLGSPVSLLLAGAGVGSITLVDHDIVDVSNLHRQIIFTESNLGQLKVEAAQQHLSKLNSTINICAIAEKLSIDNAEALLSNVSIVVDAADNFLVSYLLSDLCLAKRIPLISASVLTTHGYLGVFCGTKAQPAPSIRAIFPTPSSQVMNCNVAGVTGPSVGVIGSYQAQEVLKVLTQSPSQLLGKLMTVDLWDYRQQIIDFSQSPEPTEIAPIKSLSDLREDELLLDVRSAQEVCSDPLPTQAVNIPLESLSDRFSELNKSKAISCICKSGQRALVAAQQLIEQGFENISVTSR